MPGMPGMPGQVPGMPGMPGMPPGAMAPGQVPGMPGPGQVPGMPGVDAAALAGHPGLTASHLAAAGYLVGGAEGQHPQYPQ